MSTLPPTPAGPGVVPFAPSDIQMTSPPKPQAPLRAIARPITPNCRFSRMSENDMSTSNSWPLMAALPVIEAATKYGATVTFQPSSAGAWAAAGAPAMKNDSTASETNDSLRILTSASERADPPPSHRFGNRKTHRNRSWPPAAVSGWITLW